MAAAHAAGQDVARVHSGDPSLYGAIAEQMRRLDALGIPWTITPGVPAFAAAAAALGARADAARRRPVGGPDPHGGARLGDAGGREPGGVRRDRRDAGDPPLDQQSRARSCASWRRSWAPTARWRWSIGRAGRTSRSSRGTLATIREKVKAAGITRTALILVGRVLARGRARRQPALRRRPPPRPAAEDPGRARRARSGDRARAAAAPGAEAGCSITTGRRSSRAAASLPARSARRRWPGRTAPRSACWRSSATSASTGKRRAAGDPDDVGRRPRRAGRCRGHRKCSVGRAPRLRQGAAAEGGEDASEAAGAGGRAASSRASTALPTGRPPAAARPRRCERGSRGTRRPRGLGRMAVIWAAKDGWRRQRRRCRCGAGRRRGPSGAAEAAAADDARRRGPRPRSGRRARGRRATAPGASVSASRATLGWCRRGSGRAAAHQPAARRHRPCRSTTSTSTLTAVRPRPRCAVARASAATRSREREAGGGGAGPGSRAPCWRPAIGGHELGRGAGGAGALGERRLIEPRAAGMEVEVRPARAWRAWRSRRPASAAAPDGRGDI